MNDQNKAPERIPHCTGCGEYPGDGVADKIDALAKERDELQAEVERLRGDMQYIAKQWPDSFAARTARAALQRKAGNE